MRSAALAAVAVSATGCCWDEATRVWAFEDQVHWSTDAGSGIQDAAVDGGGMLWTARTKDGGEEWNLLETSDRILDLVRVGDVVAGVGWRSDGDVQVALPATRPAEPLDTFTAPVTKVVATGVEDALIVGVEDADGPSLQWYRSGWSPKDIPLPQGLRLGLLAGRGSVLALADGALVAVGDVDGNWESVLLDATAIDMDVSETGETWLMYQLGSTWWVRQLGGCPVASLPFAWRPAMRAHDDALSVWGFDDIGALLRVEVETDCAIASTEVAPPARKAELIDVNAESGASARLISRWTFPTNREGFGRVESVECE